MAAERARPAASDPALEAALEALYAAPFDRFVERRKELAGALRTAGNAAASRAVGAAGKPTRTAWALNQVARGQPGLVDAVIEAWRTAARAQGGRDADDIRDSARGYRDAVNEVVKAARSVLGESGAPLTAVQARRMGETVQALVGDDAERPRLRAGRLVRDIAVDDPFAGLEEGAAVLDMPDAPSGVPRAPRAKAREEDAARKREEERARREKELAVQQARMRVEGLERSLVDARHRAADAERVLERARETAARATAARDEIERDLGQAREELDRLKG